jgi:hypothetical protein
MLARTIGQRGFRAEIGLVTPRPTGYTPPRLFSDPFSRRTAPMPETRRRVFDRSRRLAAYVFLALLISACESGCVQRRLMVRSNPPGALVYVDDYEVGTTPCGVNFTYYGTRKVRLVKDGYETLTVMQSVPTPWYEYVPLDFVSENLVPGEIRDQRFLDYQLKPQVITPSEQLIARAEELRRGVHASTGTSPQISTGAVRGPAALGPSGQPPSAPLETIPTPQGVGGQPVHSLPPGGGR